MPLRNRNPYSWVRSSFRRLFFLDPDGKKRSYDIIDGQQRLTTFLILQCVLDVLTGNDFNKKFKTILYTHVNRGSAQEDLDEFFSDLKSVKDVERLGEKTHNKYSQNAKELYRLIEEFFSNKDEYDSIPKDTLNKLSNSSRKIFNSSSSKHTRIFQKR